MRKFLIYPVRDSIFQAKVSNGVYPIRSNPPKADAAPLAWTSNGAGFTLIELLLVVAILSVMASLSLPAFKKTYNRLKLQNCALDILSLARFVRTKAIVESKVYRLNFDVESKVYWLTRASDGPIDDFEPISGRFGRTFKIPLGLSLEASSDFMTFYPNAASDDIDLTITNSDGLQRQLLKSGVYGEFKIKE